MLCYITLPLALFNLVLLLWILRRMRRQRHRAAVLKVFGVEDWRGNG